MPKTDNRIGYRPGKQSQRAVLPAQQIVSQIKAPEHIETAASDTDGCDCMVVHSVIVDNALEFYPSHERPKEFRPYDNATARPPTMPNHDSRGGRYR